ncbi:MAG: hypothetical protein ACRDZQ_05580, partial [Acidimicrobiales bacterium]
VYARAGLAGAEIELSPTAGGGARTHTLVRERRIGGRPVYAAVFPALPAGDYVLWDLEDRPAGAVTVLGGAVTELDWAALAAPGPELPPSPNQDLADLRDRRSLSTTGG